MLLSLLGTIKWKKNMYPQKLQWYLMQYTGLENGFEKNYFLGF